MVCSTSAEVSSRGTTKSCLPRTVKICPAARTGEGPTGDNFVERPPFEELANDEWLAVLFARLVHCAHVRVRDERCDPCLVTKPVNRAGAGHLVGSQQLDRDLAIEPQITRPIDLGPAVPADGLEKFVVGNAHGLNVAPDRRPPVRLYFSAAYSARAATSGGKFASAAFHIANSVS